MAPGSSKPRVHWVSPLPPAPTDIAQYTARILPALAAATDLTLWTDAAKWDPALEAHCPVRRLDPDQARPRDFTGPGRAETVFVHIGNSWVFHSGFLRLVQRLPSVVVLHDMALQEMLVDAVTYGRFDPARYRAGMTRWYGAAGTAWAEAVLSKAMTAQALAAQAPGFELVLPRAISVLSHTRAAQHAVTAQGRLPAYLVDLPFAPSAQRPPARRASDGPLRLVQFGHIGPNRRLSAVLDAVATLSDEMDLHLDVMGQIWDTESIRAQITALGLERKVTLHGFVPEAMLDAALAQAHLVLNLRFPTMGEASGSQLRIWNAAAAAAVTDLGWYQDLPEDAVFKIPHEEEQTALLTLLRQLNADRSLGMSRGQAGRDRLEARHTPERYAHAVAQLASQASADAASALLARRARALLRQTADPSADVFTRRLARQLSQPSESTPPQV